MGILLCCFWGARDEEDEISDKNEGVQGPNVTNRRSQAQSDLWVQEHANESDHLLGRKSTGPENENGFINYPQVENEVIAGSAQQADLGLSAPENENGFINYPQVENEVIAGSAQQADLGLSVQDHTNIVFANANYTEVETEVVAERAKANAGSSVQDQTDKCDNRLKGGKSRPGDEQDCKNRSQVKPEVVSESKGSIPHKYNLFNDSELSRDDECPICLEEYDSENPRITTKCSHHYHLGCIYAWQERSGLCPNCLGVAEFEELK